MVKPVSRPPRTARHAEEDLRPESRHTPPSRYASEPVVNAHYDDDEDYLYAEDEDELDAAEDAWEEEEPLSSHPYGPARDAYGQDARPTERRRIAYGRRHDDYPPRRSAPSRYEEERRYSEPDPRHAPIFHGEDRGGVNSRFRPAEDDRAYGNIRHPREHDQLYSPRLRRDAPRFAEQEPFRSSDRYSRFEEESHASSHREVPHGRYEDDQEAPPSARARHVTRAYERPTPRPGREPVAERAHETRGPRAEGRMHSAAEERAALRKAGPRRKGNPLRLAMETGKTRKPK